METEGSLPNLLCKEDESSLNVSRCEQNECLEFCSVSESDCEFIEMLLEREADFRPAGGEIAASGEGNWLKRARSDAIKWILETRAVFGYQRRTAYLSAIYFDRFLTKRRFSDWKSWKIQLLSIACLSLAAKMEECEVRSLTEYHVDEYQFRGNTVQRMELLVLNALDWKMSYVTPYTYLKYFIFKLCGKSISNEHANLASDLVLAVMEEHNVGEHRPSIIAAAAVLASYDCRLNKITLENKMEAIPSWGSREKEQTISCYTIFQEIMTLRTFEPIIYQTSSSSLSIDDSKITSRDSAKRRLNFDDGGRRCLVKRINKS
ncbi:cyclin-D5-1 [Andrographis paniculata]|uniref:cyclin-D5-1 n=1 Tax=Andrographis paniculata TaxID=175694 RepID=UPI0021E7D024|nr:cyclin-D5-1 [Andrographis paniculata]